MMKIKKIIFKIFACILLFFDFMLFFGINGQSYIDPSVITYLIQIVSGLVISLGAFFGVYGRKFKKALVKKLGVNEYGKKEVESDDIRMW